MKPITMIVAALQPKLGIGYQGGLPWRLKNEMANFKKITCQAAANKRNAVIMGRKTWESIPPKFRPLPNRLNIILTRNKSEEHVDTEDTIYLDDINSIDNFINDSIDKVFLIGGSELYNLFFNSANSIILTELTTENQVEIDTYLDWDLSNWVKKDHQKLEEFTGVKLDEKYEEKGYVYNYSLYEKE